MSKNQQWEGMFGPSARSDYAEGDTLKFWDYVSQTIKVGIVQWVVAPNKTSPTTIWVTVDGSFPEPVYMGDVRP